MNWNSFYTHFNPRCWCWTFRSKPLGNWIWISVIPQWMCFNKKKWYGRCVDSIAIWILNVCVLVCAFESVFDCEVRVQLQCCCWFWVFVKGQMFRSIAKHRLRIVRKCIGTGIERHTITVNVYTHKHEIQKKSHAEKNEANSKNSKSERKT